MISQAPRSWISSPLGINVLLSLCGGKAPALDKYTKINSEMKSSNVISIRNKILISPAEKGRNIPVGLDTEIQKFDFKHCDLEKAISSWVNQHGGFKHEISKHITPKPTSVFLNISTVKARWKSMVGKKGPMMKIYNSFNYTEDVKYEARLLELPLQDDDMKFVIIVPNEKDTLSPLISTLTERGLEKAINSIQPLFTASSELTAPKINFDSEMRTSIDRSKVAIQNGSIDVTENGVSAKVLTCLLLHSSEENTSSSKEEREPTSFFFAVTFKGTAIFTGNFKPT